MRRLLLFLTVLALCCAVGAAEQEGEEDDLIVEVVTLDEMLADGVSAEAGGPYVPASPEPWTGEKTGDYWTLPMDITDEAAVWEALMRPMTVLDTGKKNAERAQLVLYAEPDENSEGVGVATCVSQGVRVLEERGDWTLIQCYSSSFHNSKVKAWNELVQGWVESKYVKTVKPNRDMGIVVDKLTQRLYLFRDGKVAATLLCSTGLVNPNQPYNETRSGEFMLLTPAVGGFRDGSMVVARAIRYNSGDLLHEVPYTQSSSGRKYYSAYEERLGKKASHGCIRVQRLPDPNGYCMKWIWDHRTNHVRIFIWEDWQGRQIAVPADDTPLYYNPKKGTMYHSHETCRSAKNVKFTPFAYGELDTEGFAKLTRCPYCAPPLRRAEIEEINQQYAPGGDHDPILTKAREKQRLSD